MRDATHQLEVTTKMLILLEEDYKYGWCSALLDIDIKTWRKESSAMFAYNDYTVETHYIRLSLVWA